MRLHGQPLMKHKVISFHIAPVPQHCPASSLERYSETSLKKSFFYEYFLTKIYGRPGAKVSGTKTGSCKKTRPVNEPSAYSLGLEASFPSLQDTNNGMHMDINDEDTRTMGNTKCTFSDCKFCKDTRGDVRIVSSR